MVAQPVSLPDYLMSSAISELREWTAEISDFRRISALLRWDQETQMPARGASVRADQIATLERLTHERFISERTGELIAAASAELNGASADSIEARIVSLTRRLYGKDRNVPTDLAVELARAGSQGYERWMAARRAGDFTLYAPAVARNFSLVREYAACFDGYDDPYDALLDDFVPDMSTATAEALLGELKSELTPVIAALRDRSIDSSVLQTEYPISGQRQMVDEVLRMMGFNDEGWRTDDSAHPFETSFSVGDVRLTNRYVSNHFPTALFGAMHECGHGLYEAGLDPALQRTPLSTIYSSAMHESQSRLWENIVGRGRAFTSALTPVLVRNAGGALDGLSAEQLFSAVNAVSPGPLRLEADEASYGLHIVIRFELERALLSGDLAAADLPGAWNDRMKDYLGVTVRNDVEGVMQDIHWSELMVGYFPAYAIGNLIAAQLWEVARGALPELDAELSRGELQGLREWLRENVHHDGSRYSDGELLQRVVGGPVAVEPFVGYLKAKLGEVYGVALP
jgi:carboxypeptidase Taq